MPKVQTSSSLRPPGSSTWSFYEKLVDIGSSLVLYSPQMTAEEFSSPRIPQPDPSHFSGRDWQVRPYCFQTDRKPPGFHLLLSKYWNEDSASTEASQPTHRTVSVLGPDLRAGIFHVRHLAGLVERFLVGVPAGLRIPVVVALSPGQFCGNRRWFFTLNISFFVYRRKET